MDKSRLADERALIRAAATKIVSGKEPREPWKLAHRQKARGTLAALDWIESERSTAPSSGRPAPPDGLIRTGHDFVESTALSAEIADTEEWGTGHVDVPGEDMHYHGGVWALLYWWCNPATASGIAIAVPGLPGDVMEALRGRDDR